MSTAKQARRYRARKKAEREAAGIFVRPRKHTARTVMKTLRQRSARNSDGCLIWKGHLNVGGYGVIGMSGKLVMAHRAAWIVAHGAIPAGMSVCHSCDVRACIEPTHLWLGSYADNFADAIKKGRAYVLRGGWNRGIPHSTETRAKIAAKALGRKRGPHTPESIKKMSRARAAWWERRRNTTRPGG